jgi:PQ loop repeat
MGSRLSSVRLFHQFKPGRCPLTRVLNHSAFCTFVTFILLLSAPSDPSRAVRSQLNIWATFLGLSSAILAALQYTPQIVHTYRRKLVGALSIPMMLIQTPGGFIMVVSIMIR